MTGVIKADFYRFIIGKSIYAFLAAVVIFYALLAGVFTLAGVKFGVHNGEEIITNDVNGETASSFAMAIMDSAAYLMLALILVLVVEDFSSQAIRNTLSRGSGRKQYLFAKLFSTIVMSVVVTFLAILIPVIVGGLFNGFGNAFALSHIRTLLKPFFTQLFLIFAASSVTVFLAFWTKKTLPTFVLFLVFFQFPNFVFQILRQFKVNVDNLYYYELTSALRLAADANIDKVVFAKIMAAGAAYIILSIIGSILVFRKCEIK